MMQNHENIQQTYTNNQPMNNNQINQSNGQYNNFQNQNNNNINTKYNKNAIYSIICSVVCWFIFGWLGSVGVSLGAMALKQIKETNEKGKILAAYAGIVIGSIGLVFYFIAILG